MLNGKVTIVFFNSWIDKKDNINEWIFSKTDIFWRKVKAELDLSNFSAKADLKNAISADTSKCTKKVDLASLKSEVDKFEKVLTGLNSLKNKVDKLDVEKLVPVPFN